MHCHHTLSCSCPCFCLLLWGTTVHWLCTYENLLQSHLAVCVPCQKPLNVTGCLQTIWPTKVQSIHHAVTMYCKDLIFTHSCPAPSVASDTLYIATSIAPHWPRTLHSKGGSMQGRPGKQSSCIIGTTAVQAGQDGPAGGGPHGQAGTQEAYSRQCCCGCH